MWCAALNSNFNISFKIRDHWTQLVVGILKMLFLKHSCGLSQGYRTVSQRKRESWNPRLGRKSGDEATLHLRILHRAEAMGSHTAPTMDSKLITLTIGVWPKSTSEIWGRLPLALGSFYRNKIKVPRTWTSPTFQV